MDTEDAAAVDAARRKINRGVGLLREAGRELVAMTDDRNVVGVTRVHDPETARAAAELIALGHGRHGAVDVVVLARPSRRAPTHQGPDGAKEQ